MRDRHNGKSLPCVLIDLNTQRDFFEPTGACPVIDTGSLYACLRRVIAWAKRNQVPVVSSLDLHRVTEPTCHGGIQHCIEGSNGQSKLPFTLLRNHVFIVGDNTLAVPVDLFMQHQQVIFPQRSEDLFANPKADRFLTQLHTEEFILFGAVAENQIKAVTLGLLARRKRVTVLVDVCGCWNRSQSDFSFRQMEAKGATLLTVDQLLTRRLPRRGRYTADSLVYTWPSNGYLPTGGN